MGSGYGPRDANRTVWQIKTMVLHGTTATPSKLHLSTCFCYHVGQLQVLNQWGSQPSPHTFNPSTSFFVCFLSPYLIAEPLLMELNYSRPYSCLICISQKPSFPSPLTSCQILLFPTSDSPTAHLILHLTHNMENSKYKFYLVTDFIFLLPSYTLQPTL